jgi:DNA-binding MarR family transcriptional regulator
MTKRIEAEKEVIQYLRLVFQAIQRHSNYVEKHIGVSASQLWAMTELSMQPGLRVSDIAERLSIKVATASNMLDKVQNKEFIERKRESDDQRVVRLYLTEKGKHLLKQANVPTQGAVLSGLGLMAEKNVTQLHDALGVLIENMRHHESMSSTLPVETIVK